ncbi:MAG: hypothetical protein PHW50_00405 [Patescibacteria group bacterium]|nr:hypothetical protein [Patescibacteria group bacterium]
MFGKKFSRILIIFIPFLLSLGLKNYPFFSYLLAWLGSIFILYWTLSGKILSPEKRKNISQRLMRPLFFIQIFFATFSALSSFFFFLDANGAFAWVTLTHNFSSIFSMVDIAECQRYYLLSHIGLVSGLALFYNYQRPKFKLAIKKDYYDQVVFWLIILAFIPKIILMFMPSLDEVLLRINAVIHMAQFLGLYLAIKNKNWTLTIFYSIFFLINLGLSFFSGWKGSSFFLILLLLFSLFPLIKKRFLIIGGLIVFGLWLWFVPVYIDVFRQLNWHGSANKINSAKVSLQQTLDISIEDRWATDWYYLVNRFSDIAQFLIYKQNVPQYFGFYGFESVGNGFKMIVPRLLWENKPDAKNLAMERVYENNIVSRDSFGSFNPLITIDSYLIGGWPIILLFTFILGSLAAFFSRFAENRFGGYYFGTFLIFNAFFSVMWVGQSAEYLIPTVFWSFIIMVAFFFFGRWVKIIIPAKISE